MPRWSNVAKRRSFWGFLLFVLLLVAWLRSPNTAADAARQGLSLCGRVIVPTLFPFFVLSNLFVRRGYYRYVAALLRPAMGPLFAIGAGGAGALALGAVGGYPIGAATAFELYDGGQLSRKEAERLLAFCNNAGPAYIFGVVGAGVLGNVRTGALIYCAHLAAALLVGIMAGLLGGAENRPLRLSASSEPTAPFSADFVTAVKTGLTTILTVCAFLCFFSVLLAFCAQTGILRPAAAALGLLGLDGNTALALLYGTAELSTGVGTLPPDCPQTVLLSVCSFLLGWGGLCVHCQVLAIKGSRELSLRPYFLGKLAQGLLAAVLVQLLLRAAWQTALGVALLALLGAGIKLRKKTAGKKLRYRV